jgi:pterin-4a-carbinolamine dehydratase
MLDGDGWLKTPCSSCFTPEERDPVPIMQEAGWAPGPVWTGVENIAPTNIGSPECPACSKSLYQLRYSGPHRWGGTCCIYHQSRFEHGHKMYVWNTGSHLRDSITEDQNPFHSWSPQWSFICTSVSEVCERCSCHPKTTVSWTWVTLLVVLLSALASWLHFRSCLNLALCPNLGLHYAFISDYATSLHCELCHISSC